MARGIGCQAGASLSMLDSAAAVGREAQQHARAIHRLDEEQPQAQNKAGWVPGDAIRRPHAGLWARPRGKAARAAAGSPARFPWRFQRSTGLLFSLRKTPWRWIFSFIRSWIPSRPGRSPEFNRPVRVIVRLGIAETARLLPERRGVSSIVSEARPFEFERTRVRGETKGTRHPAFARPSRGASFPLRSQANRGRPNADFEMPTGASCPWRASN